MLRVHRDLHIVTNDARAAATGCHGATVWIGERHLLIGRGQHLRPDGGELGHLLLKLGKFLLQTLRLRRKGLGRLMAVGCVELTQIARYTFFELRSPPLHLATREVLVAIVHGLELAPVDPTRSQQAHLTAQVDEAGANLADGLAIVLAEVGNDLLIGHQAASESHHFDVTSGLPLEPAARLNPIEIAVDVEL
jgi:hypothetical protein